MRTEKLKSRTKERLLTESRLGFEITHLIIECKKNSIPGVNCYGGISEIKFNDYIEVQRFIRGY